eukprot:gene1031-2020_t
MSFDNLKLEIKSITGSINEIAATSAIIPLLKRHHLLLVTLLLYNALAMEALPICLGALVPNWIAILLSITLVLIFGEIVPSAFFTGPKQLTLAAKFVPFVKILMIIFYPIAFPISLFLDKLFGHEEESSNISRNELWALITLQKPNDDEELGELLPTSTYSIKNNNVDSDIVMRSDSSELLADEVGILTGILRLANFNIEDVMLKMESVYSISADVLLDEDSLQTILSKGYSRIPVYNRKDKRHILGILLVKMLVVVDPNERRSVRSIALREPLVVSPSTGLLEMVRQFQTGHSHLAFVSEQPVVALECVRKGLRPPNEAKFLGMVTLEDVIEKILQDDIVDETDLIVGKNVAAVSQGSASTAWNRSRQKSHPTSHDKSNGNGEGGRIKRHNSHDGIQIQDIESPVQRVSSLSLDGLFDAKKMVVIDSPSHDL